MACGKPLVVCSVENTPVINFLKKQECAKLVTEGNAQTRASQVVNFLKNCSKEKLDEMGGSGYDAVKANYTKEAVTDKYLKLIGQIIKE